jgi:hypothetical protein
MRDFLLTVTMKNRQDESTFERDFATPALNRRTAMAGADALGLALAVASGGVLVCIATQVTAI